MGANKFCVFILVNVLVVDAQLASKDDGCRTPDRATGNCISIYSCKPIMDLLDVVPQPLSVKISNLLKQYHCGFSGKNPKVCCPSKPIRIDGVNTGTEQPVPEPPDVSGHRNLRLLPKDCGGLDTDNRVISRDKTGIFEFKWMALLSYNTSRGQDFKCGASIINNRYLLTAAHCVTNLKIPLLGVRVGEHNILTPIDCETTELTGRVCAPKYQDLPIEEIIPHPEYTRKGFYNDIALLRVAPMDLTRENLKPVCLPLDKARTYNFTGRNGAMTGWGVTETGMKSPVLKWADVPMVTNDDCVKAYKNLMMPISHLQLCAGGSGAKTAPCTGDSGGPLQVVAFLHGDTRVIQQGILSFGPRICNLVGYPDIYTRVAYYMDWILDNMKPWE